MIHYSTYYYWINKWCRSEENVQSKSWLLKLRTNQNIRKFKVCDDARASRWSWGRRSWELHGGLGGVRDHRGAGHYPHQHHVTETRRSFDGATCSKAQAEVGLEQLGLQRNNWYQNLTPKLSNLSKFHPDWIRPCCSTPPLLHTFRCLPLPSMTGLMVPFFL